MLITFLILILKNTVFVISNVLILFKPKIMATKRRSLSI